MGRAARASGIERRALLAAALLVAGLAAAGVGIALVPWFGTGPFAVAGALVVPAGLFMLVSPGLLAWCASDAATTSAGRLAARLLGTEGATRFGWSLRTQSRVSGAAWVLLGASWIGMALLI